MEDRGIDPRASSLLTKRSTMWTNPPMESLFQAWFFVKHSLCLNLLFILLKPNRDSGTRESSSIGRVVRSQRTGTGIETPDFQLLFSSFPSFLPPCSFLFLFCRKPIRSIPFWQKEKCRNSFHTNASFQKKFNYWNYWEWNPIGPQSRIRYLFVNGSCTSHDDANLNFNKFK